MWYLIFASCIGSYAEGTMECTGAQIVEEYATHALCEVDANKYTDGFAALCMEAQAVDPSIQHVKPETKT